MKQFRFSESEATRIDAPVSDRRLRLSQTLGLSGVVAVAAAALASGAGVSLLGSLGVGLLALNIAPLAIGVILAAPR